jgi:hypothetical protein
MYPFDKIMLEGETCAANINAILRTAKVSLREIQTYITPSPPLFNSSKFRNDMQS